MFKQEISHFIFILNLDNDSGVLTKQEFNNIFFSYRCKVY